VDLRATEERLKAGVGTARADERAVLESILGFEKWNE